MSVELIVLHLVELGLALANVVPDCLPALVSKTGSPRPCLGEHRRTAGIGRAACEHTRATPPVAERQAAGNEIQNAALPHFAAL